MNIKFPRSFVGYSPVDVENKMNSYIKRYEEKIKELTDQIFIVNHETELLKEKVGKIQEELEKHSNMNKTIMDTLYSSHSKATKEVLGAIREGERLSKSTKAELLAKELQRNEIKKTLQSLANEMEAVALSYKKALEAYKNG